VVQAVGGSSPLAHPSGESPAKCVHRWRSCGLTRRRSGVSVEPLVAERVLIAAVVWRCLATSRAARGFGATLRKARRVDVPGPGVPPVAADAESRRWAATPAWWRAVGPRYARVPRPGGIGDGRRRCVRRSPEPTVRGSNPLGRATSLGRSIRILQGVRSWRARRWFVARQIVSDSGCTPQPRNARPSRIVLCEAGSHRALHEDAHCLLESRAVASSASRLRNHSARQAK
jgi:hypothetical protein